jgi:hypothetical protein
MTDGDDVPAPAERAYPVHGTLLPPGYLVSAGFAEPTRLPSRKPRARDTKIRTLRPFALQIFILTDYLPDG